MGTTHQLSRFRDSAGAFARRADAYLCPKSEFFQCSRTGLRQAAAGWRTEAIDQHRIAKDEPGVFSRWYANRIHDRILGYLDCAGPRWRTDRVAAERFRSCMAPQEPNRIFRDRR